MPELIISSLTFSRRSAVVSRQKQLNVVFDVANAQKQGVMGVRLALASSTTMFQESAPVECSRDFT